MLNQVFNAFLSKTTTKIAKSLSVVRKDVLDTMDVSVTIEAKEPIYYVAEENMLFVVIAKILNDTRSSIPTTLLVCDVDIHPNAIYTDTVYDVDKLILAKIDKFKAYNFKYLTYEDMDEYFNRLVHEYLVHVDIYENKPNKENLVEDKEEVYEAALFINIVSNNLPKVKQIFLSNEVSLMPNNRRYFYIKYKSYEFLLHALSNLNRDMVEYILQNSSLKMNSPAVKEFIMLSPSKKIKKLCMLYKHFTGESIRMKDFKGLTKLKYIRSLL